MFWQDETSTIESETQRPRQTRFQLLKRSESQKYSSADDPLYVFFRTYLSVNLIRVTVVSKLIFNNIVSYNHKSLFKLYIYQKSPYNHFIYFYIDKNICTRIDMMPFKPLSLRINCPHWDLEHPDSSISSSIWSQNFSPQY